jgi:hypothetical protein
MEEFNPVEQDEMKLDAEKRVKKIKKFYKELASWAGASVFMIALDLFLSHGITWSKFPVFFWGITLAWQFFEVLRLQKLDKEWEDKMMRKFLDKKSGNNSVNTDKAVDYSEELLHNQEVREKELANLAEYRKVQKPWKDEDLV